MKISYTVEVAIMVSYTITAKMLEQLNNNKQ